MKRIVLISLVAVAFVACKDALSPTGTGFETADFELFDGTVTATAVRNRDVFFLPPLVVDPGIADPEGNFEDNDANPDLDGAVVARICRLSNGVCFADLPMVFTPFKTDGITVADYYLVNWLTRGLGLAPDEVYRIQIFLLLSPEVLVAFRDVRPVDRLSKKEQETCSSAQASVCKFVNRKNGATVPIKVRIESAAVCIALDSDFPPASTCGAGAYDLSVGGSSTVKKGGTTVALVDVEGGGTGTAVIVWTECDDLHDDGVRSTITDGLVDLPTFGDCLASEELAGITVDGTLTLCAAFDDATTTEGLLEAQAKRMTVHRFGEDATPSVALPHNDVDAPVCPTPGPAPAQALELNSLERFVRFARNTWRAVSDQVRAWIEPAPLWAKMAVRCNRGGCSSSSGFRSHFMAALPAWMKFDPAETPSDGVFGDVLVGTPLTIKVNVVDSGEFEAPLEGPTPPPVPLAVAGVRLTFTITDGGGTFGPTGPCVGETSCTLETDGDGNAAVVTAAVLGANEVEVTGIGVGTGDDATPLDNVFASPFTGGPEVPLAVGTLTFTATGALPDLEITSLALTQTFPDEDDALTYNVTVTNQGPVATAAAVSFDVEVALRFDVCGAAGAPIGSLTLEVPGGFSGSQAFGGVRSFGADFGASASTLAPGEYCLTATADPPTGVIDESDEGDNVNELSITVLSLPPAYGASGYSYLEVAFDGEPGFEAISFVEGEAWSTGSAPFGSGSVPEGTECALDASVITDWALNTDMLLRKTFALPSGVGIEVSVAIDNDIQVFINGTDITATAVDDFSMAVTPNEDGFVEHEGCATQDSFTFSVSAGSGILVEGENLLAVRARDRGVIGFVDVEVTVIVP